ncbi:MAG: ribosome maturation factor RimP [Rubrobacter sp.]|nr:ribosome maturation factor RimP [Rubrobacter sp.]
MEKVVVTARLDRLAEVVEGALPEGTELVEARFSGGPLLTLLVDRMNGPMDHEFTSRLSKDISPALEGEGYDGMVEVSSPGIERPLTKPEHFRRFVGHEAKIRVSPPVDGKRNFTGIIESADDSGFALKLTEEGGMDGGTVELAFGSVTSAHLKEEQDK